MRDHGYQGGQMIGGARLSEPDSPPPPQDARSFVERRRESLQAERDRLNKRLADVLRELADCAAMIDAVERE